MKSAEISATVTEPDHDGFVWLSICEKGATCAHYNLGTRGDADVRMVLRAAGLDRVPRAAFVEDRLASLH